MTSFRNNNIKFKQEGLSDDDVLNLVGHTSDRARLAQADLAHITGYAIERGLLEIEQLPEAEVDGQPELPFAPDEAS